METKRARGKCIANALVCQLCWTFLLCNWMNSWRKVTAMSCVIVVYDWWDCTIVYMYRDSGYCAGVVRWLAFRRAVQSVWRHPSEPVHSSKVRSVEERSQAAVVSRRLVSHLVSRTCFVDISLTFDFFLCQSIGHHRHRSTTLGARHFCQKKICMNKKFFRLWPI